MIGRKKNQFFKNIEGLRNNGISLEYSSEQFDELKKCRASPLYFVNNYVKIRSLDHEDSIPFTTFPYQDRILNTYHENQRSVVMMSRQQGKDQPLDTPIPTPNGWSTIGDLKVGDYVFARNGTPTKVNYKSEIYTNRKCYKFIFDTGEEIISSDTHLWTVCHQDWKRTNIERTLETKDIVEKFNSLKKTKSPTMMYIKMAEPLILPEKNLEIDPYTLGVWLGDGSSRSGQICGLHSDLKEISSHIPYTFTVNKGKPNISVYNIHGMYSKIKKLNLWRNKHIPEDYLRASFEQRLNLLRGLMDTDGWCCTRQGRCEFYQKEGKLIDGVGELLSSLGIKWRKRIKNLDGIKYYSFTFCSTLRVFNLGRKAERQKVCKNHPKNKRIYIQNIIEVESVPTQCIGVDDIEHLYLCGKTMVPTHNTVTTSAYILWSILFHAKYNVVILAYDLKSAVNVLNIIKGMYEELPYWMQQGIEKWSEKNIVLENGSTVLANATTKAGVRGKSCNLLYIDEFGIVDNKIAPVFLTASYPVIFSSKKAKIIVSSTPLGYNHFYDLWKDAESGKNGFVPVKVHYSEHPGRDEEWANEQLKLLKRRAFNQEVLCQFAGSANTLLDSTILERIHVQEPISEKDGLKIFEYPVPDRKYVMTVDTAEGIGQDRSTFVVMDITERPYRIVATYQSDSISYLFFPDKIKKVASDYNEAYVLVETNSVGNQVAVILHNDLEYENILRFISEQKKGQILSSDSRAKYGLVMSAKAKSIGCRALRTLMEEDLITINDSEILHEFNNFVEKGNTFKADDGYHDDLVMTLVSFAYLTQDKTFQTYIDTSRSMEFGKQITRETGDIGTPSFFYFDDGSGTEVEDEEELIGF